MADRSSRKKRHIDKTPQNSQPTAQARSEKCRQTQRPQHRKPRGIENLRLQLPRIRRQQTHGRNSSMRRRQTKRLSTECWQKAWSEI